MERMNKLKRIAVCPGSFDPITFGHIDIIKRASQLFDEVVVLISVNTVKSPSFTESERMMMIKKNTSEFGNVVIEAGAVGTPAIVSDIPGPIDTIIQNETALVVPVKDVHALTESLEQVRKVDYNAMGKKAAQFAREKFDSKILCEKILERKQLLIDKVVV